MNILSQIGRQLERVRGRFAQRQGPVRPVECPNQEQLTHALGKLTDAKLCECTGRLLAFYQRTGSEVRGERSEARGKR